MDSKPMMQAFAESSDGREPPALRAVGLRKDYRSPGGLLTVLDGLDIEVARGTLLAIVGASGSGKTTLLNLIGCVDVPTRGTVVVAGQDTGKLTEKALTELRLRKLGFIFQGFNQIGRAHV